MEINAVRTSYRRWAPVYDRTFGAATNVGRRRTVEYINGQPGGNVLEVGVGTGMALPFYRPDIEVTGIDFSHEMLAKARQKVRHLRLGQIKGLQQMDARDLQFADASFDTVAAMHIVSVVPEPERVVTEMARVCRPGGRVVITNHFARETGFLALVERFSARFDRVLGWHSDFPIERVLGEPGLQVIEKKSFPPLGMMTFLVLEKAG